jgi:hypothetical protein
MSPEHNVDGGSLLAVGFWSPHEFCPDPRDLAPAQYPRELRSVVTAYLREGAVLREYLGYSYCRFGCGIADSELGCSDLSDGTWVWPSGLAHYIEVHDVSLPPEFLSQIAMSVREPIAKAVPQSVNRYDFAVLGRLPRVELTADSVVFREDAHLLRLRSYWSAGRWTLPFPTVTQWLRLAPPWALDRRDFMFASIRRHVLERGWQVGESGQCDIEFADCGTRTSREW